MKTIGRGTNGHNSKPARAVSPDNHKLDEELQELRGRNAAIDKVQAVIEFALDGTVLTANENFPQHARLPP
jgi:hypothetical protein